MPIVPSRMPAQPRLLMASPPGSSISISATRMGVVAITSAAKPLGTIVSAQVNSTLLQPPGDTCRNPQPAPARKADRGEDHGRKQSPARTHQRRRELSPRNGDRRVGRSPKEVHQAERKQHAAHGAGRGRDRRNSV